MSNTPDTDTLKQKAKNKHQQQHRADIQIYIVNHNNNRHAVIFEDGYLQNTKKLEEDEYIETATNHIT